MSADKSGNPHLFYIWGGVRMREKIKKCIKCVLKVFKKIISKKKEGCDVGMNVETIVNLGKMGYTREEAEALIKSKNGTVDTVKTGDASTDTTSGGDSATKITAKDLISQINALAEKVDKLTAQKQEESVRETVVTGGEATVEDILLGMVETETNDD